MTNLLDTAAKAFLAGLLAGLAALGAYLTAGETLGTITGGQWVFVASATVLAFSGVYTKSNLNKSP